VEDVLELEEPEPPFEPPFDPPFPPPPPFRFSNPTYSPSILVGKTTGRGIDDIVDVDIGMGIEIGTSRTFSLLMIFGTFTNH
jgi:hypothetical protein